MDKEAIRKRMQKTIDSLDKDLAKIRTGMATPAMLDDVMVDYYGTPTSINHMASVTVPEPRILAIQPFEKNMLSAVEKAIQTSELGLPPNNDGTIIRLTMPILTGERREELAKKAKSVGENAKVGIRNIRRDENAELKSLEKKESEDMIQQYKDEIQTITDNFIKKVDETVSAKENDIMQV